MSQRIHLTCYEQRCQGETVLGMTKRRLGSAENGASFWSQCRALMLKAVAHNVLVVLCALCAPATLRPAA
jgi:hypothetical protein